MKRVSQILWLAGSVLLLAAGICCLVRPDTVLVNLIYVLGALVLLSGILTIIVYFQFGRGTFGGGWMLFDGIVTILLATALFAGKLLVTSILPYMFAVWIFIQGIIKINVALDLRRLGVRRWWAVFTGALLCVALGMLAAIEPMGTVKILGILAGVYLIFEGATSLIDLFTVWRRKNYFKDLVIKIENNRAAAGVKVEVIDEDKTNKNQ